MSAALTAFAWGFAGGVSAVVSIGLIVVAFLLLVVRPAPAPAPEYPGWPQ